MTVCSRAMPFQEVSHERVELVLSYWMRRAGDEKGAGMRRALHALWHES